MRDLSAKMPAMADPKTEAKMPATMASSAPATGDGGPSVAPNQQISQANSGGVAYDASTRMGEHDWAAHDRVNSTGWETADRKGA